MNSFSKTALPAACLIGHSIAAPTPTLVVMLLSHFRDNGKDGVFLATGTDGTLFLAPRSAVAWIKP
jgi:hypothetical protein